MNTKTKLLLLSLALILGFSAAPFNTASAQYVVPACNSATLNGTIVVNGAPTTVWFEWGPSSSLIYKTPSQTFSANSSYSQLITGLSGNTVYYYRAMATNINGDSTGQTVSFTTTCGSQQTQNPTVALSANPTSISYNGSSVLTWSSTNAATCTASNGANGWAGNLNTSGTFPTGILSTTTTYNITCTNSVGSANSSATVYVNQNQTCQDYSALNYGGVLPCRYNTYTCQDPSATNYGSNSSCVYRQTCTDYSALNYGGILPCRYQTYYSNTSVTISADRTSIAYGEGATIRWYPVNATSCVATGGNNGWAGTRNTYTDSFYTGPLYYTTTFTISCSNYNNYYSYNNNYNYNNYYGNNSDTESVTIYVGGQIQVQPANYLNATTLAATQITNTSAQLNSLISNSGNYSYSANSWFEWGNTIALGNKTTVTALGVSPSVARADTLTGLSPGTTYYFKAVAENSLSRNVGNILSFTTTGQQPVIIQQRIIQAPTSRVLITSSVDRNQPIVPTIDNTRPHPGDEINYTVNYQNIGTGAITNLVLQMNLPQEVDYLFSNPGNPNISGNNLVFNLGTLKANGNGIVTVRVRVRENIPAGTSLNFPATLSYTDPSGQPQSVSANVSAQVWSATGTSDNSATQLGANAFGAGFLPTSLFGWLFLIVLILVLIALGKHIYNPNQSLPFTKKTTTTTIQH